MISRLDELSKSDAYPYHMPGHKRRLDSVLMQSCLSEAAALDITEIDDFDNLHEPEGILKDAMERTARLYGADTSYFCVNGSTAGILTAISAAVPEGKKLIMARNCHRAVYHAVYLRRLKPIYLYPETIPGLLTADVITKEQVKQSLLENPDAAAVLLVSPTYDGITADIGEIAALVHTYGIPLIVDAAHGAHYGFHPAFPESPVRLGADLTVVSLHKTMPCMTQTALLHVCGSRVIPEKIRFFESIYQTSSPSYFLMAGMDACMALVEEKGAALWDIFFKDREDFLRKTNTLQKLHVVTEGKLQKLMDPGKILIDTSKTGLTGKALYDILLKQYHLQMEMAAQNYVTAIMTCCDSREGWERLADALLQIDRQLAGEKKTVRHRRPITDGMEKENGEGMQPEQEEGLLPYPCLEPVCSISDALDGKMESVSIERTQERICGTFINLYPPGIPLVVPGEKISPKVIELIEIYRQQGLQIQGMRGDTVQVLL